MNDAAIARIDVRATAENLIVADSIQARITARTVADSIVVTDTASAKVVASRNVSDELDVIDALSAIVSGRSAADAVAITDQIEATIKRALSDTLTVADAITTSATRALTDTLSVADTVTSTTLAKRTVTDTLDLDDRVEKSVAYSLADAVTVSDTLSAVLRPAIDVNETVTFADQIHMSLTRAMSDSVMVQDLARQLSIAVNVADSLTMADQIKGLMLPRTADQVTVTDTISLHVNRLVSDAMSISDLIITDSSTHFTRDTSDALEVVEAIVTTFGKAVNIDDAVAVNAPLTNVSVHWNKNFGEGFDIAAPVCLPNQCLHNIVLGESFQLGAAFSPPPQIADTLVVTDSITRGIRGSAVPQPTDLMSFSDSVTAKILGILVVEKKEYAGPLPSTPIIGTFTYTGNAADLKAQIQPLPIPINGTVVRPSLPGDITILRTFHVPITPNADIPGDDVIVSETHKEVPALSNMFMRLNFKDTPELAEHTFIQTLDIEFTPKVDSTDFGLVVSLLDAPPGVAPLPLEELRPIYIDVRWVGNFPGSESPAAQTYYQNPPQFTFTVNEEWVREQEASMDANGVPNLKLWLLDESANEWSQVTSISKPTAGKDGIYTFVATLPHFSDYAITATRAPILSGGHQGGKISPETIPQVVAGTALAVDLAESLAVGDVQESMPVEVIEEFAQKKLRVMIADTVGILVKPVSYRTFQVGDVEVRITVQDVRQENVLQPKATATFLVEMENLGGKEEKFTLNFWYYDQSGKRPYESSQVAEVGPHESRQLLVNVPFTEPGVFEVTAEARSIPGGDLVNTAQLTVTIPWLAINLYFLVVVAIAILGMSGGIMAVMLRGGLAGAGAGTTLFFLARKRKPAIRVTDRLASIEEDEYDIIIEVHQREAQGAQAVFDLEIVNRTRRTQEFMLKYWAADSSGIRMSERVEKVRIKGRTAEVRAVQMVLPQGRNIFVAEAGPVSEKQARWSHAGIRVKND